MKIEDILNRLSKDYSRLTLNIDDLSLNLDSKVVCVKENIKKVDNLIKELTTVEEYVKVLKYHNIHITTKVVLKDNLDNLYINIFQKKDSLTILCKYPYKSISRFIIDNLNQYKDIKSIIDMLNEVKDILNNNLELLNTEVESV